VLPVQHGMKDSREGRDPLPADLRGIRFMPAAWLGMGGRSHHQVMQHCICLRQNPCLCLKMNFLEKGRQRWQQEIGFLASGTTGVACSYQFVGAVMQVTCLVALLQWEILRGHKAPSSW